MRGVFSGLQVLLQNVSTVSTAWQGSVQASLFLRDSVDEAAGAALAEQLARREDITASRYISRAQSLAEFRALSGFSEALDLLSENPLPAVIVVAPAAGLDQGRITDLVETLGTLPEVELAKLDQQWLQRLHSLLQLLSRGVWLLAGGLALAVVVTVGNTIRLDIEHRRDEIVVMKLIGAPASFIRRPFLYTGFWYGLAGGLLAWLAVQLTVLALSGPAETLAELYGSDYRLRGLGAPASLSLLLGGLALGLLGAAVSVQRQLRGIEPGPGAGT
jgi:cell division transport system permease protein